MSKKQTAVDWLIGQISEDQIIMAKSLREWLKVFDQAKAMEKEQLKEMYLNGIENYDPTFKRKEGEEAKERAANYMRLKGALDDSKGGEQ